MQDTLRNNHAKFHPNPFSSFRGEEVWKIVNDDNEHQVMEIAHTALGQMNWSLNGLLVRKWVSHSFINLRLWVSLSHKNDIDVKSINWMSKHVL